MHIGSDSLLKDIHMTLLLGHNSAMFRDVQFDKSH